MSEKICVECGYKNPPEAKFCVNCGAKLVEDTSVSFISQNQLFLRLATIVSVAALLDILTNYTSWGLLTNIIYIIFAVIGIVGSVLILYGFFGAKYAKKLRYVYLGSLIAGIGFLLVYVTPLIAGKIFFFPAWIIFIYIFLMIRKYGRESIEA